MVSQKLALNNDIVLMRHLIRQVKVHIFHKLTKNVKNLRNKKGNESLKQKSEKKAERLVEELLALKKFDNDLISKDILLEKRTANIILSDINSTIKDRVLAKVMTFSKVSEKIKEIREKYPESLIIEFVKSNKNRNKKNKKINKSNEKSSKKKEDEGVLNNSKKRKIEIDEEKETLTDQNEEVVSNKSKKKKLKSEGTQEGVKSKKNEKNISNKLNRKEKTDIESDENVSGDEIEEKETLTDQNEEVVSNKLKKKKLKSEIIQEGVKSKKKEKNISKKLNRKEKTDIESDENVSGDEIKENDNSETLDPFFLMSNEDEEMVSNESKKKKLTKQGKKEIVKSKTKEGDEKINSKKKKKKENTETQNERENGSGNEIKENGESETEESFDTSLNGQHERDDQTISNKLKKKKEKEKKQRDKEDVFKDEIKMNKKPKENKQIMEKTVDPFFLMSNGQDEYLSIVQTTPDDSTVKQQNRTYTDNLNRKQRRQLQKNGGKVTKRQFYDKISTNRSSFMNIDTTNHKFSKESSNKPVNVQKHSIIDEVQNLHPSWQAKLVQKPSVVQFQGKKIVFDET